jgi:hypothetical protein
MSTLEQKDSIIHILNCIKRQFDTDQYSYPFEDMLINNFIEIGCFFYLVADENILNKIYYNQINFGYQDCDTNDDTSFMCLVFAKYFDYIETWCDFKTNIKIHLPEHIKIPLQNKIKSVPEYDDIINKLNTLKKLKTEFIISKYNECLKHLEYAEEECLSSEKLLLSLSKINKYDSDLDNLVTNIIDLPIRKHTFCISTHIDIDINVIDSTIFEHQIIIKFGSTFRTSFECLYRSLHDSDVEDTTIIYMN